MSSGESYNAVWKNLNASVTMLENFLVTYFKKRNLFPLGFVKADFRRHRIELLLAWHGSVIG